MERILIEVVVMGEVVIGVVNLGGWQHCLVDLNVPL